MLDHLLYRKIHTQLDTTLDLLLQKNNVSTQIEKLLQTYIMVCKVEGISINTITIYSRAINMYIKFAKANRLPLEAKKVSINHVRAYIIQLQKKKEEDKLSSYTVNGYCRPIKTFFNWLVEEHFLDYSPIDRLKLPKIEKKLIRPFSPKSIDDILALCSGSRFLDLRNRAIVLVFFDTGLRLEELSNIQISDVNFDTESIKVMGKGAKERIVRIGKNTQKALLKYLLSRSDEHPCLWVTEESRPMKKSGIQTLIKRLCHRAGIVEAKPGPHSFRHTSATHCRKNGMSIEEIQIMLGHSSPETTRRYLATIDDTERMMNAHRIASPVDRMFKK